MPRVLLMCLYICWLSSTNTDEHTNTNTQKQFQEFCLWCQGPLGCLAGQMSSNHREKGKVVEFLCNLTPIGPYYTIVWKTQSVEYLKTSRLSKMELAARIQSGTTRGVTKCAGVSVAVVTAGKYGLGLRQIRILTRENTACRDAEKYALANTPNIFIMHDDHIFSSSGA